MPDAGIIARTQRIPWLQPSTIALMLANLVPLGGVFWFHWEVFPLLVLFWLENIIIGVISVLKMLLAGIGNSPLSLMGTDLQQRMSQANLADPTIQKELNVWRLQQADPVINRVFGWALKIFFIPFFCFHYGLFTMVHGVFVMELFGPQPHARTILNAATLWRVIQDNHLVLPFAALAAGHAVSFVCDYLWRGEFRRTNAVVQMVQPYQRVMLMHVTVIGGGFLMVLWHSPAAGLALLTVLKTVCDVRGHLRERERLGALSGGEDRNA